MDNDIDDLAHSPSPLKRRKMVPVVTRHSLTAMLSSWGALKSPTSVSQQRKRDNLRTSGNHISYAESPHSTPTGGSQESVYDDAPEPSEDDFQDAVEQDEQDEDSEDELADAVTGESSPAEKQRPLIPPVLPRPVPQQRSLGTRDLPARSTRSNVSYARVPLRQSPAKISQKSRTRILSSNTLAGGKRAKPQDKTETARNKVRSDIAAYTKPKRDAFLLTNKEYFLPLLPDNNYIAKLERTVVGDPEEVVYRSLSKQPAGVTATMKPYQLEGLAFLVHMHNNGMSAILGDEMGLGKTLQTLSLFQYLAENQPTKGEHRPYLVVCPLSVLSSWISETKKWVPGVKVMRFHGPKLEREKLMKECLEKQRNVRLSKELPDLVVTTYETFKAEASWFKRSFVWRYCVLDEGHTIKNDKTAVSSALQGLSAEYRLLLTGTPLQNNLREMWALLHWLFPEVFISETEERFRKAFDLSKGTVSTSFMDDARRLLEVIMLRRMKASPGVNLGLPPKEEILLYVPLTPMQQFWYKRLLTRENSATLEGLFADAKEKERIILTQEGEGDDEELALLQKAGAAADAMEAAADAETADVWAENKTIMREAMETEDADRNTNAWQKLMNLLMQLRKVCSHPYLLPNAAPHVYEIGDHVKNASGKFIVLDKLLQELVVEKGKKVLIFSGFTRTLDLVGELLHLKGANDHHALFRYARLDGSTGRAQRNLSIRMFNDKASEYKVMLLSTRAGGLGINLTSATDVVFMDEDWNPQVTLQAEARAHRIGQTLPVTIYKLCSQGTVEEQMMGRIRKKLYLSAKITESMRNIHSEGASPKKRKRQSLNDGSGEDDAPHLDTASLQSLIRRGAQTLARPQVNVTEMLGWDWSTVLHNCKDKPVDAMVTDGPVDEQAWLNSVEQVQTAIFEGKKHSREIEKKVEEIAELNRTDRRVGKNTTVEIDGFMISKESLNCGDWEAVPTFAGKDPRLAEPVRAKKEAINSQDFCQCCWEGGEIVVCKGCPRAYHRDCLSDNQKRRSLGMAFYCAQHECHDCSANTTSAGGLIFRCRWCEKGFCEDCLDWDTAQRVGHTLPEFETLGFGYVAQAYYIDCPHCVAGWEQNPAELIIVKKARVRYEKEYQATFGDLEADTPDTISEVATPIDVEEVSMLSNAKNKGKARTPAKRVTVIDLT